MHNKGGLAQTLLASCAVRGGGELGQLSSAPLRQVLEQVVAEHPNNRLTAVGALHHPYLAVAERLGEGRASSWWRGGISSLSGGPYTAGLRGGRGRP